MTLTVKHVVDQQETIIAAPFGASYTGPNLAKPGERGGLCIPKGPINPSFGVECDMLFNGIAYVMNDTGATVGTYVLGPEPEGLCAADTVQ